MQAVWAELWGGGQRVDDVTGNRVCRTTRGTISIPAAMAAAAIAGQTLCQITTLFSDATHACDYFGVKRRSATDLVGDEFKVAKVIAARMAASYTADGETYTYDYTAGGTDGYDNNRVSTKASDSSTEAQRVYQIYYVGQLVMAIPTSLSFVVPTGGSDLKWIEDASDRGWTAP